MRTPRHEKSSQPSQLSHYAACVTKASLTQRLCAQCRHTKPTSSSPWQIGWFSFCRNREPKLPWQGVVVILGDDDHVAVSRHLIVRAKRQILHVIERRIGQTNRVVVPTRHHQNVPP